MEARLDSGIKLFRSALPALLGIPISKDDQYSIKQSKIKEPEACPGRINVSMRMMFDIFREVMRTLWAHKLRSFLTMFGIAWGVGSLLLLVGLGEGFRSGCRDAGIVAVEIGQADEVGEPDQARIGEPGRP